MILSNNCCDSKCLAKVFVEVVYPTTEPVEIENGWIYHTGAWTFAIFESLQTDLIIFAVAWKSNTTRIHNLLMCQNFFGNAQHICTTEFAKVVAPSGLKENCTQHNIYLRSSHSVYEKS